MNTLQTGFPKILFVDHTAQLGGAELLLASRLDGLKLAGSVLLLEDGPFLELLWNLGLKAESVPINLYLIKKRSGLADLFSVHRIILALYCIAKRAKNYQLICTNSTKSAVLGMLVGYLCRIPVVVVLHDIISPDHFDVIHVRILVALLNALAAKIVVNSSATLDAYVAAGGKPGKVELVYPEFAIAQEPLLDEREKKVLRERLDIDADTFVIGCFSRIAKWKGQHALLESIVGLNTEVALLICGAPLFGEEKWLEHLKQEAQRLGVEEQIHFLGFRSDVEKLMQICDVVVNPSVAPEPFGMTIVEAQLVGRCVIATDAGGTSEIIQDGKTGLLVPIGDISALRETLAQCMNDRQKLQTIGQNAQRAARRFQRSESSDAFSNVLSQSIPVSRF